MFMTSLHAVTPNVGNIWRKRFGALFSVEGRLVHQSAKAVEAVV
jgi:hypothetical protein